MKPKAFSYIRFSTPEQAKGNSLQRQLQKARDYAAANDLDLDESLTFEDRGVSAFTGRNFSEGRLAAFVAACEAGRVPPGSFLLVENLDRLSRQTPIEAVGQLQKILKTGVTVVTLHDRIVFPPDALNDFSKLLLAVVTMQRAHEESVVKGERVSASWAAKRQRAVEGKPMTGICPGWLKIAGDQYEVVEERAEVVREIFDLAIQGYGKTQIAKLFNERQVAPFGRGEGWHFSSIQKILESEAVIGVFQPHRISKADVGPRRVPEGDPIRDYFPPVISEEKFLRARAARAGRRASSGRKGERLSNLFTGLAVCGHCGGPMHFDNKGDGYTRLTCANRKRGVVTHAGNSWNYPLTERYTLLALREALGIEEIAAAPQAGALAGAVEHYEGQLLVARERHAEAVAAAQNLVKAIEEGVGAKTVAAQLGAREAEVERTEVEIKRLEDALVIARAAVEENKIDRQGTEEALMNWATVSEGKDVREAYSARHKMQQLLKRMVASVTLERSAETNGDYGQIAVTLKGGAGVHLLVSQANENWEMRARAYRFAAEDARGVSEMTQLEYLEVPDWWPVG